MNSTYEKITKYWYKNLKPLQNEKAKDANMTTLKGRQKALPHQSLVWSTCLQHHSWKEEYD